MKRALFSCALVLPMVALLVSPLVADVKTRDKTQFKLEGMLGKVVGMFGGKAAREGIVGTAAVQGDRKVTRTENNGQIIDLGEEKVYDVDYRKKEYRVTTFEEMRRRIREEQEKARKQAEEARREEKQEKSDEPQKEYEIDFDVKETGEKKPVAGFDARQVIMTVTLREKGKALDESGGFVMTSDTWFGPEIPALKELTDFDMRYYKQLYGDMMLGMPADQMAMVMAMYPMIAKAADRLRQEGDKLKGTPLSTSTTFEAVLSKEQLEEAKSQEGSGGGGLGGMLARRMMKKEPPKQRSLVFTLNHEYQEVSNAVAAGDVDVPAGFKEKK